VQLKVNRVIFATRRQTNEAATPRMICCFEGFHFRPSHEGLVAQDVKTGLLDKPGVASEWKLDTQANNITFKLRQGIQFHPSTGSGQSWGEMTAKDVVFTWESLVANEPVSFNTWVPTWWKPFTGAEATGEYEVTFTLSPPQAQVWFFLSDVFNMLGIRSKAQHEREGEPKGTDSSGAAGTGPYLVKERKPSEYIRFERVPYKHWRATPDFPELEFRWINEPSTRMAALLTGEVHITDLPGDLIPQAETRGMKRIENQAQSPRVMAVFYCCYPDPQTNQWPLHPDSVLLDPKVREGLNRAINREELGKAFAPNRKPLHLSHYNPQRPAWDPTWETRFNQAYGFGPERARQVLAEAGYGPARPLEIDMIPQQLAYIADGPDITEAMASYFRNVGVKVSMVQLDPATEQAQVRAYRLKNLVRLQSIGGNLLDSLIIWNLRGAMGAGAGYYIPELLRMRDELNREMDPEKQVPHLRRIGEWGFTNYWDIPLWYVPLEVMVDPKIVENWSYPGSANGGWSHFETIRAAR